SALPCGSHSFPTRRSSDLFSLPGHPNVFAIGDLASLKDTNGTVVPGVAQGAMQAGVFVCDLVAAEIRAGNGVRPPTERPSFAYKDKGIMATIGRKAAVAQIDRKSTR